MNIQITPSQQRYADAHQNRLDRLWPVNTVPLPRRRIQTQQEWFAYVWHVLDGPINRFSIREIQDAVCRHFKVPFIYMESTRRTKSHYMPRSVAMFLCSRLTNKSSSVIGRSFGNRDHTTVLHNIKVVEKMTALNHPITKDVRAITRKLGAIS